MTSTEFQSPIITDRRAVERVTTQIELAAAKSTIRDLQALLAAFAPLEAAYDAEMAGRRKCRFAVEPLDVWARDLARKLGGDWLNGEDAGDVADHLDGE